MDEKIRFLEERKLARTIKAEQERETEHSTKQKELFQKTATNPIGRAFLKFVHTKHKFNIEDL